MTITVERRRPAQRPLKAPRLLPRAERRRIALLEAVRPVKGKTKT